MIKFDFVYDGYASLHGTPDHLVPRLDPTNLCDAPHGLSGTEVNMFGLAQELAYRGHQVRIHSKWTHGWSEHWTGGEGAIWYPELGFPSADCDVVVSYHDARPLDAWKGCLKIAHHQSYGLSPQEDARNFADLYWTPTERVSNYHRQRRGWEVITIPNAWNYGKFCEWKPVKGRLIYHTSMERGFHRLVEAFPLIKERVPEAYIQAFTRGGPQSQLKMVEMIAGLNRRFGAECGSVYNPASRNQVLRCLSETACFAYPCDVPSPCEVWPMSVTDALATGVPVVLAPDDGIEEVFGNRRDPVTGEVILASGAQITPSVKEDPNWKEEFVDSTVRILNSQGVPHGDQDFWHSAALAWSRFGGFTFKNQCDRFLEEVGKRI